MHLFSLASENYTWPGGQCSDTCVVKRATLPSYGLTSYYAIPNHGQGVIFSIRLATNPRIKDKWWESAFKRKPSPQLWILDINEPPVQFNFDHLTFQVICI